MKKIIIMLSLLLMTVLAACGQADGEDISNSNAISGSANSPSEASQGQTVRLNEDYRNALPIQSQLAAGTLLLEASDQAVDEALAEDLLPLWQALQSLSTSDTASSLEIDAVISQIQDTMTQEQVNAIAAMELTEESLTEMMEQGELSFGFGRGLGQSDAEGGQAGGLPGDGLPGRGFGGGPGGGFGGQGGPGGGFGGQAPDPDASATRQAQFAEAGPGELLARGLTGAVVRLLGARTGDVSPDRPGGALGVVFEVVGEATGLTVEEIRTQTAEGASLDDLITANGADVSAVREAMIEALNQLPNADDLNPEEIADQWLGQFEQ